MFPRSDLDEKRLKCAFYLFVFKCFCKKNCNLRRNGRLASFCHFGIRTRKKFVRFWCSPKNFEVAQSSEICAHAVCLRVKHFRAFVAAPFLSFHSCTCAVHVEGCACAVFFFFFACGGLTSVEHWACPRLWRAGRGSVFVFACVFLIWFLFVGGVYGGCLWWRLESVRRVSLCFFFFIRRDREVATHSSCSPKSSHFVRLVPPVWMLWRPARPAAPVCPASPASPAGPASLASGLEG